MGKKISTLFAKQQRIISDKYRDQYDQMEWQTDTKIFKVEKKGNKTTLKFK